MFRLGLGLGAGTADDRQWGGRGGRYGGQDFGAECGRDERVEVEVRVETSTHKPKPTETRRRRKKEEEKPRHTGTGKKA